MFKPDETPAHAVDEMVRDAADAQRARGLIPHISDARRYLQGVVEDVEKRNERDRHRIKPKPAEPQTIERSTDELEAEANKRLASRGMAPLAEGNWSLERKPAQPSPLTPIPLAQKKLKMILAKPDIFERPDWVQLMERAVAPIKSPATKQRLLRSAIVEALAVKRIRLLLSKPEWKERFARVNPHAGSGMLGLDKQRHATKLYADILKDSVRVFGEWMKLPTKQIISYGGQAKR